MEYATAVTDIESLSTLSPADLVKARDTKGAELLGEVENVAYEHGMLWVRTDGNERKLLDIREHKIWAVWSGQ